MAAKNEVAAQIMEHLCSHDWHGYTQGNRWGDGGSETLWIDSQPYVIATGDRDCSSAIISAYQAAGVLVKDCGATYTGNMKRAFLATGMFEWKPMSFIAQRGDVYLNEANHTAMCTSPNPDMLAEFSISENGGIYGNVGDQTNWESHVCEFYDYPWDGILHYIGGIDEVPSHDQVKLKGQQPGDPVNDSGFVYRAHVQNFGWCDPVRDGQVAGTTGQGLRLEAFKVSPPEGLELNVKAHIQNVGWKTYEGIKMGANSGEGSSENDPIIGTVGESKRLEAIEVDVVKNATGKKLKYQVHCADVGWTGWIDAGYSTGSVGMSRGIEAVQFVLE